MMPRQAVFDASLMRAAEAALDGMSDTQKVHFALKIMLDVNDPRAIGPLSFAVTRLGEHAGTLARNEFQRECG